MYFQILDFFFYTIYYSFIFSLNRTQKNKNNGLKFDPKYYIFGEKPEKDS